MSGLTLSLLLGLDLFAAGAGPAQEASQDYAREDPNRYVGAERCGECHVSELEVWKRTPHSTGFKTLHRKENAETIAQRLGFRLIKRDSLCVKCHYTPLFQGGQLRARSGVSCESCHGAARDWLPVHNDYGGPGLDYATETPEHRDQRGEESRRKGMRRPTDLLPVAASCFECHLVLDERLVNVGGHSTGSGSFELVKWSQGEIRHNYLDSQRGGSLENQERSAERKRVMYVVGRALEVAYSLRGVARAQEAGIYVKAMVRRNRLAVGELKEIGARASVPEVDAMLSGVREVKVRLGNGAALLECAQEIEESAKRFLDGHDGSRLAALDPLVAGSQDVSLAAEEERVLVPEGERAESATPAGQEAGPPPESPRQQASRPSGEGVTKSRVVGRIKTRLRPRSENRTLGTACSGCHAPQNEWWFDDAHFASADPFFDEAPNNVQIARLYGIRPDQMTRGNQVCMDCHGTVVSGKESREVQDGVGCESCHGAAEKFLEPHKEGEKSLGVNRPGYKKALQLGMVKLQDLGVRARTCTGCHYITEPRLLSAGHPSGAGFDWVRAMGEVRHWEHPLAPPGELEAAFSQALAQRGAVPDVPRAELAGEGSPGAGDAPGASPTGDGATSRPGIAALGGNDPPRWTPPRPRPLPGRPSGPSPGEIGLPPFPDLKEDASVEEVLLMLKERLEELHRAVFQNGAGR